jgi:hypothetical protein
MAVDRSKPEGQRRPVGEMAVLALLVVIAVALRMSWPQISEFKRDEAQLSLLAQDVARGRALPVLGMSSSVGIPNAPMNIYITAIPYLVSSDPAFVTQFFGLTNVLALVLAYVWARRWLGVGLWAAALAFGLFAVSPWAVIYSRKIWAQDLLPLFSVLTLGAGVRGLLMRESGPWHRWAQALFLPLLSITGQIHYGAFVLIPPALYCIWLGRGRLTRWFWLGAGVALLLTLPYLIGLAQLIEPTLARVNNGDVPAISDPAQTTAVSAQIWQYAVLILGGTEIHALAGASAYQDYLTGVPSQAAYALGYVLVSAMAIATLWALRASLKRPTDIAPTAPRAQIGLLLLWLLTPPLAFTVTWTTLYPHYLIPMLPPAFMLLAWGLHQCAQRPVVRWTLGAAALAIAGLQVWLLVALAVFVAERAPADGFGTPLGDLLPLRAALLSQRLPDVVFDIGEGAIGIDERATIWAALLYDLPSVRFADAQTQVTPAAGALIVRPCADDDAPLRRFQMRASIPCLALVSVDTPTQAPAPIARFENGVALLGVAHEGDCIVVAWQTDGPQARPYSFAVNWLGASGERIGQADAPAWNNIYWRAGDVLRTRFCGAGSAVAVRLGLYHYDGQTFANAAVTETTVSDHDGQSVVMRWGN